MAAKIDKHTVIVFRMRHKLLAFLEAANEEIVLSKPCEADEKYINECHKGLVHAEIAWLREMENHFVMPRTLAGQEQKSLRKCALT